MDIRVQDYLDDKFQSSADLESLDSLLDSVKAQQDLLKKQLDDARRLHSEAKGNAHQHREAVKRRAHEFQKQQQDIDTRLLIVTQSETSDEAAETFEASMQRLRKLDVAAGYMELLKEVDALRSSCISQLGKSDDAALAAYQRLKSLVSSLGPLSDAAEGAAPHLLDYITNLVKDLHLTIKKSFSSELEKTLKKLHWPKTTDAIPLALEREWQKNIGRLLDLQKQNLEDREHDPARDAEEDPPALYAFEVLVQELKQRFDYHFSGNKPTNRLDKPEFFLHHALERIEEFSGFVDDSIQPILLRRFQGSDLTFTPAYIDATSALITALLPMLRAKIVNIAAQLQSQPSLLSHFVQEVIKFDVAIQETYDYAPSTPSLSWRGLSYYLLETRGYFDQWLAAERDFALARYQSIIEAPDAGDLDYDSLGADATKPTKAAIRLNDLLETITERYRELASFKQKIKFLMDVQIQIFDLYFQRLRSGLEAYLTMTSTVGRTMQTVTKEEKAGLQGVKRLDRLCRIFGSAEFLERAMRDWSDDVFFLGLWAELSYRAQQRGRTSQDMGNWVDIQQKTSSALGDSNDEGQLEGALFDETANAYRRVRIRSESTLTDVLKDSVRQALKPYAAINTWASLSSSTAGSATSAELDPLRSLLDEYLGFLRRAVGRAPLRRIVRQVCHAVQAYLWENVLARASFSTAGATQLTMDLRALCATFDRYIGAGQAQAGMRRLLEGVTLLSLPVRGEIPRIRGPQGAGEEDDGRAWEAAAEGDGDGKPNDGEPAFSLFQVERLIFRDNEGARQVLEQMGLETLSEGDARTVLGKRVELAS